jgi:hypothetical protein
VKKEEKEKTKKEKKSIVLVVSSFSFERGRRKVVVPGCVCGGLRRWQN